MIARITWADFRAVLTLAFPIVIVQVGLMSMGVVDAIFVGHVNATQLAAAALGNLYFFALCVFGMGILMALDPVVSQAVGAGDTPAVARAMQRGFVLGAIISVPTMLMCLPAEAILRVFRQPAEVIPLAARFVGISAPGAPAFFAFVVMRQSLQAMKRLRPILGTIIAANLLNAFLNWVFVFGNLGSPALGAAGSALGSTIGRYVMTPMLLVLSWRDLRPHIVPFRRESLEWAALRRMLEIGFPIGAAVILEFSAFALTALFAGWFGTNAMAGHQVAINLASLTFMVPLGVSNSAAVLVGHAIGAGDSAGARRAAAASLVCGVSFMAVSACALLGMPGVFARTYTSDPAVVAVAMMLIPIAGVFQVFDGLQVVAAGILRGVGDTRAPMVVSVLGFWLVGIPVSLGLGFGFHRGVVGLWWGFVAGLVAVATFLLVRVRARLARALERVRV